MSEMVERVARAIAKREWPLASEMVQEKWAEERWRTYEADASAAIEAMRDPFDGLEDVKPMSISYTNEEIWNMMIDAALKRGKA